MSPPTELRLKFSEDIVLEFTKLKLTGPDGLLVKTGNARIDSNDKSVLIIPLSAPLPEGKYTVDWQVVASDGHKTKGSYGFESMK